MCSAVEKVGGHEELEGDVGGDGELGHLLSAVHVLNLKFREDNWFSSTVVNNVTMDMHVSCIKIPIASNFNIFTNVLLEI